MRLTKNLATLSILLIIVLSTINSQIIVKADAAGISLISNSGYLDLSKNFHVVGEVLNIGIEGHHYIKTSVTYYDNNNQLIASRFDLAMLNIIMPGRKSPFDIALLDNILSAQVDHYSVSISLLDNKIVSSPPLELEVTSSSFNSKSLEPVTVTLRNKGAQVAENVKIVATYYDGSGQVIAASVNYINDEDSTLGAGTQGTRSFPLDSNIIPYIVSYRITAESTQYGIVSEISENARSPRVSNTTPADGSEDISSSTKTLNFTISEPDGTNMSYYVSLEPGGFRAEKVNVGDGSYSVAIPSLGYETDYVWTLSVRGGNIWTNNTYTFRTETSRSPRVSNTTPADGSEDISSSTKTLNFTISEPDGTNMSYYVSLEPGGFRAEKVNVGDGSYSVAIPSLGYETDYVWTLSVRGGNIWTNNTYTFRTDLQPQSNMFNLGLNPIIVLLVIAALSILILVYWVKRKNNASIPNKV